MRSILAVIAFLSFTTAVPAQEVQAPPGQYKFQYIPILTHPTGAESALYFISTDTFESYGDCVKGIKRSDRLFKEGMLKYRKMPLKSIRSFAACSLVGKGGFEMLFPVED